MAMTQTESTHFNPCENYMNQIFHGHIPSGRNQPAIKNTCQKQRISARKVTGPAAF